MKRKGKTVRWAQVMGYLRSQNRGSLPFSQVEIARQLNSQSFSRHLERSEIVDGDVVLEFVRFCSGEWCLKGHGRVTWPRGARPVVFAPPPAALAASMFQGVHLRLATP